jgi:hypothetical protein
MNLHIRSESYYPGSFRRDTAIVGQDFTAAPRTVITSTFYILANNRKIQSKIPRLHSTYQLLQNSLRGREYSAFFCQRLTVSPSSR